jgi:hypothetical protein
MVSPSMELVLATMNFSVPGGSETYLLTVASQLERLGHSVTVYAQILGQMADLATEHGIRVTDSRRRLPARCDAALVQDGVVSYALAERYPDTPQVFRATSEVLDVWLPPNLPGLVSHVVVLSDRVGERVHGLATSHEVVRLRQPIDSERLKPAGDIRPIPRRAVLVGNYLRGERRDTMRSALTAHGIECAQIGATASISLSPEAAMWDADIVVAKGRAAVEGMACGRAVFVYDAFGSDGWVTPGRYRAMEADNFAGQATDATSELSAVIAELARYAPEMGRVNRDLATRHHGARYHANQLSQILGRAAAPAPPPNSPLAELARLVRLQWQTAKHVESLEQAHLQAQMRIREREEQIDELWAEHRRLLAATSTRRHRLGESLGRVADRVRRAAGRAR